MQTTKVALWVNRRSDLGNPSEPPAVGTVMTLVDAAIGEWPKKWESVNYGLIGRKIDQVPVSVEAINQMFKSTVHNEDELQRSLVTILQSGQFHSFEYIAKLARMLRTAKKKNLPLNILTVVTTVQETL